MALARAGTMVTITRLIAAASLALMVRNAAAQEGAAPSSSDYARMAAKSWAAFECAALAGAASEKAERSRLFKLGYDHGMTFLYGLSSNKITDSDKATWVPWGFLSRIEAESRPDFTLGRVWEAAATGALEPVMTEAGKPTLLSEWSARASNFMRQKNCKIL
ncbi:hypothetical protein AB6806_09000 [Bosea sp. RCC_152_1]|uniref:hypothetical protein n=1 Tax=Bosea sp. RCC_152_1 TaxID=3239228 RepID=UPI003524B627